eukprot:6207571-Pleurochrysis_carterae.AAC.3
MPSPRRRFGYPQHLESSRCNLRRAPIKSMRRLMKLRIEAARFGYTQFDELPVLGVAYTILEARSYFLEGKVLQDLSSEDQKYRHEETHGAIKYELRSESNVEVASAQRNLHLTRLQKIPKVPTQSEYIWDKHGLQGNS